MYSISVDRCALMLTFFCSFRVYSSSVNVALFGSSAWHLGRKIKADYM